MSSTNNANEIDQGKLRTLLTNVLNKAASKEGHTLLSYDSAIAKIFESEPPQEKYFQAKDIGNFSEFLEQGDLYINKKSSYIKLKKYQRYKEYIESVVSSRLRGSIQARQNWMKVIDELYGDIDTRREIFNALKILETSKISILQGKDENNISYIRAFASGKIMERDGVLILTPTGKAKVQLENLFKKDKIKAEFQTIASFQGQSGGFNIGTLSYRTPSVQSRSGAKTVIIYESSRLYEEELAGIFKLIHPHADRIIFAGDPNQLPPNKAGKPFVDMINYFEATNPKIIIKSNTGMHTDPEGDDHLLAQMFTNGGMKDNQLISRILGKQTDNRLKFIEYSSPVECEDILIEELVDSTNMSSADDIDGFNRSLGAQKDGNWTYYSTSEHINDWQILTTNKARGIGSRFLNNRIHKKYRQDTIDDWNNNRLDPKPQTNQDIVFGDKVIFTANEDKKFRNHITGNTYISNGEIGIMAEYPRQNDDDNTDFYKFRFASHEEELFSYKTKEFFNSLNSSELFELAYAITIKKSQGSRFRNTFVVINGKYVRFSRELFYTAFTRHTDKLTIISDLSIEELVRYADGNNSETNKRYTDLFKKPLI